MSNDANDTSEPVATVTQETLDATPERALKFLRGAGTVPAIRAALLARGYTQAEHDRGWTLLHEASGFGRAPELGAVVDHEVQQAIAEVDAWDEDAFRIVRAAFANRYPEQAKKVLDGIGPATGAAALVGVELLLERLDALAKSQDAKDRAAMQTLATRGLTPEEQKRVRALVGVAKKGTSAPDPAPEAKERAAKNAARQKALVDLRVWYEEWSEMARVAIKRRDRLILLGLAKRRAAKKAAAAAART